MSKRRRFLQRARALALLATALAAAAMGTTGAAAEHPRAGPHAIDLAFRPVDPVSLDAGAVTVLIFVRTDCPISNRYAPELRRLSERFGGAAVRFHAVYPGPDETSDAVAAHARDFRYGFGALRDPEQALVRRAGATVTPEAAVFVGTGRGARLVYRGRIDDRHVELGRSRKAPARRDLEDVLQALGEGRAVALRTTSAIGCAIAPRP